MTLNSIYVDNLIKTALLEDINYLDTTTDYLIDENQENTAIFLAKVQVFFAVSRLLSVCLKFFSQTVLRQRFISMTATSL